MLSLGASKPWKEVMAVMTGEPKMDTAPFREYFKPLEDWLKEENRKNGVQVGWKTKDLEHYCESGSKAGGSSVVTSGVTSMFLVAIAAMVAMLLH